MVDYVNRPCEFVAPLSQGGHKKIWDYMSVSFDTDCKGVLIFMYSFYGLVLDYVVVHGKLEMFSWEGPGLNQKKSYIRNFPNV